MQLKILISYKSQANLRRTSLALSFFKIPLTSQIRAPVEPHAVKGFIRLHYAHTAVIQLVAFAGYVPADVQ